MKHKIKYGKSFYATLLCFVLIIIAMGAISIGFSLYAIQKQDAQAGLILDTVVISNRDLICKDMELNNLQELYYGLNAGEAVTTLSDSELQERLDWLNRTASGDSGCYYIYYLDQDRYVGETTHEEEVGNAIREIRRLEGQNSEAFTGTDHPGLLFIGPDSDTPMSVRWIIPEENICLMMLTYGKPDVEFDSEVIETLAEPECYFYDTYGNAVPTESSSGALADAMDFFSLGQADEGSGKISVDGTAYRYSYATIPDSGSRFAIFTKDNITQEKNRLIYLSVGLLSGVILLGILAAVLMVRKIYQPMEALMQQMNVDDSHRFPDEYGLLQAEFRHLGDRLTAQQKLLASGQLVRLLHGDAEGQSTEGTERYFFDSEPYAVASIRLDEITGEGKIAQAPEQTAKALEKRVTQLLQDYGCEFLTVWDNGLLILIVHLTQNGCSSLQTMLDHVRTVLESSDGYLVSAFISRPHCGRAELPYAAREIQHTLEYGNLQEKYNAVMSCETYTAQFLSISGIKPDNESLAQLTEAITGGQTEQVTAIFDHIAGRISSDVGDASRQTGLLEQRMLMRSLQSTVISALLEMSASDAVPQDMVLSSASRLDEVKSLRELKDEAVKIAAQVVPAEEQQNGDSETIRFGQMEEYIRQHFRDPNFSSYELADAFNTCPSNITRLFKKYKSCGFLEYLHQLRLNQAKKLLTETAYPVADVAIMVGYSNALTMTRAFKRYMDTTPGAFRKSAQ